MRIVGVLGAWLLSASLVNAEAGDGLTYRFRLQGQGELETEVGRFRLHPIAALRTHNRHQPPRMGGWRLEPIGKVPGSVLVRLERLLYLGGPSTGTVPRHAVIRYGKRLCQVWDVGLPTGGGVYAYLVEVKPGMLALSYLSGSFAGGDLRTVEIQLEKVELPERTAPAEEGAVLLKTLAHLDEPQAGAFLLEERVE